MGKEKDGCTGVGSGIGGSCWNGKRDGEWEGGKKKEEKEEKKGEEREEERERGEKVREAKSGEGEDTVWEECMW